MRILNDKELIGHQTGVQKLINDLDLPSGEALYHKDSPVQPCSIDLHIGEIYLPPDPSKKKCDVCSDGHAKPLSSYRLEPGETAVVTTKESFHLPNTIGAIGFPPSHVSSKGILMTNPGHVDPGYQGSMRFTVINMGSDSYFLKAGRDIVTVLLFEIAKCERGYIDRGKSPGQPPDREALDVLAPTFMGFKQMALRLIDKELFKIQMTQLIVPVLVAIVGVAGALAPAYRGMTKDISSLKTKISTIQKVENLEQIENDHSVLIKDIRALKKENQALKDAIVRMDKYLTSQKTP